MGNQAQKKATHVIDNGLQIAMQKINQSGDQPPQQQQQQYQQQQPPQQVIVDPKQKRIQNQTQEVDAQLKRAAQLCREGELLLAKEVYVSQAEVIMDIMKNTADDQNFQESLKIQLKSVITKVSVLRSQIVKAEQLKQQIEGQKAPVVDVKRKETVVNKPAAKYQPQFQPAVIVAQPQVLFGMPEQERKQTLAKLDNKMVENIMETILDKGPGVRWDDIEGLADVKQALYENIIYPQLKPEIFTGIRSPTKGILLYGPPGNGKTMLAKAVATECKSTFFSISASTLVSKWMGESEKLMRTLFALAAVQSPSIIFIDEVDSILTKRSSEENEASRRLKTEFLIQLDGVGSSSTRILVIAATNRPFDLDEAALRRLTKRIYIGLPDAAARKGLILRIMKQVETDLSKNDYRIIIEMSDGYSSADISSLCKDAAMQPLREIPHQQLMKISNSNQVRKVNLRDFEKAFKSILPSVSKKSIQEYHQWHQCVGHA